MRNVRICGTGSYVSEQVISNEYLAEIVGTDTAWMHSTLGIKERRWAAANECTFDLGALGGLRTAINLDFKNATKITNNIPKRYY